MRTLAYRYAMQLDFEQPVRRHSFQLRCLPCERAGQHIVSESYRLSPDVPVSPGKDGFGNRLLYGIAEEPHIRFSFETSGKAEMTVSALPDNPLNAAKYLVQTPFTCPGHALHALYNRIQPDDPCPVFLKLMHIVHSEIAYKPSSTCPTTTAETAALQGCGVCQDHAQILLSLLRMHHIPCRYVSGLLIGEGSTHAWVEAFIQGAWIGLDPTNDMVVQDTHIVTSVGRDHSDCEINRGIMFGCGKQHQTVNVTVSESAGQEEFGCR